jgi:hypothetical protein
VVGTAIVKIYSPIIYGTFLADLPIERAGIQHTYTENSTKGLSSMSIVILHYTNRQILIILMGKGLVSLMITIVIMVSLLKAIRPRAGRPYKARFAPTNN